MPTSHAIACGLILALATGATSAGAGPEDPGAEATSELVALRFAWPPGLRGSVETTQIRTRSDRTDDAFEPTLRYDFEVRPDEQGLLIHASNGTMSNLPEIESSLEAELMRMIQEASARAIPDIVVSRDGAFVDVADLDRVTRDVRAVMKPVLDASAQNAAARQQLESVVSQIVSADALRAASADDWNTLVGSWAGVELELGAVYEVESTEIIAVLGGAALPMQTKLAIVDLVPCHESLAEPGCVRIESVTRPSPEELKLAIEEFTASMMESAAAGDSSPPEIESMSVITTVRLITEPRTLIPHHLETQRSTQIEAKAPDGKMQSVERLDRRTHIYRYDPRKETP